MVQTFELFVVNVIGRPLDAVAERVWSASEIYIATGVDHEIVCDSNGEAFTAMLVWILGAAA
jgi:hypothetical protein